MLKVIGNNVESIRVHIKTSYQLKKTPFADKVHCILKKEPSGLKKSLRDRVRIHQGELSPPLLNEVKYVKGIWKSLSHHFQEITLW